MDSVLLGRAIDSPLDAPGEQQAQRLAGRLAAYGDLQIEASPRRRTQQTAAAIAAQGRAEVRTSPDLDEVDFGRWAGQPFASLAEDPEWRRWNEQRSIARTPAGDTMSAVLARTMRHLQRMHREFPSRTVAIVTHAEIIRATLLHYLGASLDHYARLDISPASISTLSMDGDGVIVHSINERMLA